jgi:predicted RNase H-like HicB family nuclease
MKKVYPVILNQDSDGVFVTIPDFDINTQGEDLANAIYMARDAIGIMGVDYMDDGKELPEPYSTPYEEQEGDIKTLVDIDFTEYKKRAENKAVKKNCTIPYWLSVEADRLAMNYSQVLQEALVEKINAAR